jgi:hypothetical protein
MGAFAEEPARGGLLRRLFDVLFERVPREQAGGQAGMRPPP